MVTDYAEQILQAVDIVVNRSLSKLSFDKTEICTVVNNSDKKNGKYIVSNGSIKFEAFINTSNGAETIPEYKVNDSVRVSIPNGDFTLKYYIEGLSVGNNDATPITYVSPLETILDISGDVIPKDNAIYGLQANNTAKSEICLWSANLSQDEYKDLQSTGIYNTIALKADFKTLLSQYNVNNGSYGLRVDIYYHPTNDKTNYLIRSAYLDSSNMFGNPYSFLIYSTQAIKFNISDIGGVIDVISVYFYQNNNFTYLTDNNKVKEVPVSDNGIDNLLVRNICLSLGSNIEEIGDNTFKIYTNESLHYNSGDSDDFDKSIGLLWYNKDSDGKYIGFSDGYFDPSYNELDYLRASAADARLMAQQGQDVPTDELGLSLAADITDAPKIISDLNKLIS